MLKVNELFAGIGAFRKALSNLNIPHEVVGTSEIDKFAINAYNAIYGETRNYGDISKVSKLDYADLWTYGFPCQDISSAGLQKGIVKGETRSGLLFEVQRLLGVAALYDELPKYLIMENVKNLVGKKFIKDFEAWINWLSGCGYNTYWQIVNAADYGIPQRRERVIAVSVRKDIDTGFLFPQPTELSTKFRDLLEDEPEEKFFLSKESYEYYVDNSEKCKANGKCEQVAKLTGSKWDSFESSARIYGTGGLCPTLTACGGGHTQVKIMDKSNVRKLTPREYWRLMGFADEDFDKAKEVTSNSQLYKQAGNSIVVNVLEAVLGNLIPKEVLQRMNYHRASQYI